MEVINTFTDMLSHISSLGVGVIVSLIVALVALLQALPQGKYARSQIRQQKRLEKDRKRSQELNGMAGLWSLHALTSVPREKDIHKLKKALISSASSPAMVLVSGTSGQGKTMATVIALARAAASLKNDHYITQVIRIDAARLANDPLDGIFREISSLLAHDVTNNLPPKERASQLLMREKVLLWIEGLDEDADLESLLTVNRSGPLLLHLTDTNLAETLRERHSAPLVTFQTLPKKPLYKIFTHRSGGIQLNETERTEFENTVFTPFAASIAGQICKHRKAANKKPWGLNEILHRKIDSIEAKRHRGLDPWVDAILDLLPTEALYPLFILAHFPEQPRPQTWLAALSGIDGTDAYLNTFGRAEGLGLVTSTHIDDRSGNSQTCFSLAHASLIKLIKERSPVIDLVGVHQKNQQWLFNILKELRTKKSSWLKRPQLWLRDLNEIYLEALRDSHFTPSLLQNENCVSQTLGLNISWGNGIQADEIIFAHWKDMHENKENTTWIDIARAARDAWSQANDWERATEWQDALFGRASQYPEELNHHTSSILVEWRDQLRDSGLWRLLMEAQVQLLEYLDLNKGPLSDSANQERVTLEAWLKKPHFKKPENWPDRWLRAQGRLWEALVLSQEFGFRHPRTKERQTTFLNDAEQLNEVNLAISYFKNVYEKDLSKLPDGSPLQDMLEPQLADLYELNNQIVDAFICYQRWFNRNHPHPVSADFSKVEIPWRKLKDLSMQAKAWDDTFEIILNFWKKAVAAQQKIAVGEIDRIRELADDSRSAPVSAKVWLSAAECCEWLCHQIGFPFTAEADLKTLRLGYICGRLYSSIYHSKIAHDFLYTIYIILINKNIQSKDEFRLEIEETLARVYLSLGQYEKAISLANTVHKVKKEYLPDEDLIILRLEVFLAELYSYQGKLTQAHKLLLRLDGIQKTRSVKDEHDAFYNSYLLASIYLKMGQPKQALKIAQKNHQTQINSLMEGSPNVLLTEYQLTVIYKSLGLFDRAISLAMKSYDKIIEGYPNLISFRSTVEMQLSELELKTGKVEYETLQRLKKIEVISLRDEIWRQSLLAASTYMVEDFDTMRISIQKIFQFEQSSKISLPLRMRALLVVAEIHLRQNRLEKALNLLEKIWEAYGNGPLKEYAHWRKISKHRLQLCLLRLNQTDHTMYPLANEMPLVDPINGQWPV